MTTDRLSSSVGEVLPQQQTQLSGNRHVCDLLTGVCRSATHRNNCKNTFWRVVIIALANGLNFTGSG